jgi:hypothetical protein
VLSTLCGQGVAFVVIEGFKTHTFPKVVIGDLEIERCVLRNPRVTEVLTSLDRFEEYVTIPGIIRDLETACGTGGVTLTWSSSSSRGDSDRAPWRHLAPVEMEMRGIDGVRGARVYVAREYEAGEKSLSVRIGVTAVDVDAALCSIKTAVNILAQPDAGGEQAGE